ncbi:hypothetical protein FsymDg_0429 [Candidatus Protofrankia datiscae]|uniref:Uncharacterized protein n=2 Tax=Candidatus Protofrankia datiscae TaxID=2716812 RepID=F8B5D4_9ACTN|nr:hypothetical protein FsymDg_0429 [Candidatus Protofrankia datiscae]
MTRVWLSLGLPADPGLIAEALGPDYDILPPSSEPPFESPPATDGPTIVAGDGSPRPQPPNVTVRTILVVTMYDRELLPILATRSGDTVVVVVTPPGVDVPADFGAQARADVIGPATSVADVVALVNATPSEVPASAAAAGQWWVGSGQPGVPAAGGPGAPGDPAGPGGPAAVDGAAAETEGQPPGEAGGSHRRRNGLIAAAAVLVVVLGTGAAVLAAGTGTGGGQHAARSLAAGGIPGDGTGYGRFPGGGYGDGYRRYGGFPEGGGRAQDGPRAAIDQEDFQECLRSKGVTVDDGTPVRPDPTDSKAREVFRECFTQLRGASGLPGGGSGGPAGQGAPDGFGGPGGPGGPDGYGGPNGPAGSGGAAGTGSTTSTSLITR